jgi:Na+-driven multidrug efflux pump
MPVGVSIFSQISVKKHIRLQFFEFDPIALGIGNRLESISVLTCFGFSQVAAALVRQNLGAKKPERAEKCVWRIFHIVVLITGFISILFFVFPEWISSFFISDAEVVKIVT